MPHASHLRSDVVKLLQQQRRGRPAGRLRVPHLFNLAEIPPDRVALLVIDMQQSFFPPHGLAMNLSIVPYINHAAAALRSHGGVVCWITSDVGPDALENWSVLCDYFLGPLDAAQRRLRAGGVDFGEGYDPRTAAHGVDGPLCRGLDLQPQDLVVKKDRHSAFAPGGAQQGCTAAEGPARGAAAGRGLEARLRAAGVDTLLIAGCLTNCCCEATGHDAMQRNFRVVLLADACVSWTDADHNGALTNCVQFFGDVMTVEEVAAALRPARPTKPGCESPKDQTHQMIESFRSSNSGLQKHHEGQLDVSQKSENAKTWQVVIPVDLVHGDPFVVEAWGEAGRRFQVYVPRGMRGGDSMLVTIPAPPEPEAVERHTVAKPVIAGDSGSGRLAALRVAHPAPATLRAARGSRPQLASKVASAPAMPPPRAAPGARPAAPPLIPVHAAIYSVYSEIYNVVFSEVQSKAPKLVRSWVNSWPDPESARSGIDPPLLKKIPPTTGVSLVAPPWDWAEDWRIERPPFPPILSCTKEPGDTGPDAESHSCDKYFLGRSEGEAVPPILSMPSFLRPN